jgi:NitT/TauT family transport system permease protein
MTSGSRTVRRRLARAMAPVYLFVAAIGTWVMVTEAGLVAPYLLPAPLAVVARVIELHPMLLGHTLVTALEIILGFLLALVVGVLLAIGVVYVRAFESAVYPWIVATQAVPKVAIGPLFVVWLGFGLLPKVVIAFLIAFFPILIDTVMGLRSVEAESIFLLQSMGGGRWKIFRYLRLPSALPNIFAGMKVAITLATVGAIVGEFVGSNDGLGYVLLFANGTMDTSMLFGALVLISLLAVGFYLVIYALDVVCIRWHVSRRSGSASMTM